jgi:hypothetical protein
MDDDDDDDESPHHALFSTLLLLGPFGSKYFSQYLFSSALKLRSFYKMRDKVVLLHNKSGEIWFCL